MFGCEKRVNVWKNRESEGEKGRKNVRDYHLNNIINEFGIIAFREIQKLLIIVTLVSALN